MINMDIAFSMIMRIKMIYSEEIIIQVSTEKRDYFFSLINSIPEDLFDGEKNPYKAIQKGKKLSSFLSHLNKELQDAGVDIAPIKAKMEDNNKMFKKAIRGF